MRASNFEMEMSENTLPYPKLPICKNLEFMKNYFGELPSNIFEAETYESLLLAISEITKKTFIRFSKLEKKYG